MTIPIDERRRFLELVSPRKFTFAKTMPDNPHSYTVKKEWENPEEFIEAASLTITHGHTVMFGRGQYRVLDINGYRYWTMGTTLHEIEKRWILNRRDLTYNGNYDFDGEVYDNIYDGDEFAAENKIILDQITVTGDVLDIGCGTGALIDMLRPVTPDGEAMFRTYVGVEPSKQMTAHFASKHAGYDFHIRNCPLADFVGGEFDTIVALFGVGSYLTDDEWQLIDRMLKPHGTAYIMTYAEGYDAETTGQKIYHRGIGTEIIDGKHFMTAMVK